MASTDNSSTGPAAALVEVLEPVLGAPGHVSALTRITAGANRETWSFDYEADGETHQLILQRDRGMERSSGACAREAKLLKVAAAHGVPVAEVVVSGDVPTPLERSFTINRRIEGETIARRLLRDPEWEGARKNFVADCAKALAAIHRIPHDALAEAELPPFADALDVLRDGYDLYKDAHPAFDLAIRWLELNRPAPRDTVLVHGDFRMGNLLLGPDGLRAALDWEIPYLGQPAADLGWLCVRAWRFGSPHPVGGIGEREDLLAAYAAAGGEAITTEELHWWETFGTLRWGIICLQMGADYRSGRSSSVEIATIGRRVAENELDVLHMLPTTLEVSP